jgi:hypothetical protein
MTVGKTMPRNQAARAPRVARRGSRAAGRPGPPRRRGYRSGLVVGYGAGLTTAMVVAVLAALLSGPLPGQGHHQPVGANAEPAETGSAPTGPAAVIDVSAEHLGNLEVRVEAEVTSEDGDALMRADVVAYADMVEMPMSHRTEPAELVQMAGRPGVYGAVMRVAMVGDYEIAVQVSTPLPGEAREIIEVTTVQPGDQE